MVSHTRVVSGQDNARLIEAVERARGSWQTYAPYLDLFRAEIRRAPAVPPERVPGDVITMNSRFALTKLRAGWSVCYTLVYPGAEAPDQGCVSVLSPMGMALYGARVGDEVCWDAPDGPEAARVERLLYQPEAAGEVVG
jgi:regulator of nucleoside diphosphate kinase